MKRMKLLVVVALALTIFLPGMALAYIQGWSGWTFTTEVDTVEGFIVLPINYSFAGTGFDFATTNSGWSNSLINSQYAFASGPATIQLNGFTVNFTGNFPASTTYMDWYAYSGGNGGTIVGAWRQQVGYNAWADIKGTTARDDPRHNMVPLPPSVLLMGSGLLRLAGYMRRKKS